MTDELPKEEITGKVTPEDVETLCKYLYFADQSYDCGTEGNLKKVLDEHGKLLSRWLVESSTCSCQGAQDDYSLKAAIAAFSLQSFSSHTYWGTFTLLVVALQDTI